ncbi:unnamed protein product [Prorocentrum cordatum]|uniref:Uncharacterized protein n=1 Tax=Prorocentrum cordatum TaxID=2364126 RepID=A0ABN9Q0I2_9DINO|nr:unnamed protein product [Polarella glacialis]
MCDQGGRGPAAVPPPRSQQALDDAMQALESRVLAKVSAALAELDERISKTDAKVDGPLATMLNAVAEEHIDLKARLDGTSASLLQALALDQMELKAKLDQSVAPLLHSLALDQMELKAKLDAAAQPGPARHALAHAAPAAGGGALATQEGGQGRARDGSPLPAQEPEQGALRPAHGQPSAAQALHHARGRPVQQGVGLPAPSGSGRRRRAPPLDGLVLRVQDSKTPAWSLAGGPPRLSRPARGGLRPGHRSLPQLPPVQSP